MEENTQNDNTATLERVKRLESEISSLKKKTIFPVIFSLLLGGGGVFGMYRWFTVESKISQVELKRAKMETALMRYSALNAFFEDQIEIILDLLEEETDEQRKIELNREIDTLKLLKRNNNSEFREGYGTWWSEMTAFAKCKDDDLTQQECTDQKTKEAWEAIK